MTNKSGAVLTVLAIACWGGVGMTQQQAAPKPATPKPSANPNRSAASQPATYRPTASVQELMAGILDPSSKIVFSAVSTESTAGSVVEKVPANAAEWAIIRHNALMMVEAANLLLMPGRHMATAAGAAAVKPVEGELMPAEIEVRVAKDRATWNRLVAQFRDAALVAFKAADARDPNAVGAAAGGVNDACENCHLRYWYPDQTELLEKADRALQKK